MEVYSRTQLMLNVLLLSLIGILYIAREYEIQRGYECLPDETLVATANGGYACVRARPALLRSRYRSTIVHILELLLVVFLAMIFYENRHRYKHRRRDEIPVAMETP